MILLLSPYQNAPECAAQMERAMHDKVKIVDTVRLAIAALRTQEFDMLVADENLLEGTPGMYELFVQRLDSVAPIILDLACLRPEKIAILVANARKRRDLELQLARDKAIAQLRSEIISDLTGPVLSSQLALTTPGFPSAAGEKLNAVLEIAQRMQSRLNPKES